MSGFVVPGCGDLDFWLDEQRAAVRYTGADERALRHAVGMLDRLGDRAGALLMHDEFTRRVRQALDVEAPAETEALIATLKSQ